MTETKYWLWLSLALGSYSRKITAVLEHFDSPEEIYNCKDIEAFKKIELLNPKDVVSLMDKSTDKVNDVWETCKNKGIRILTFSSPMYPENLANIYDPPYVLYVKCKEKYNLNDYLKIAMVGNREATNLGLKITRELATDFAKSGALVVSGMAKGVDGAANAAAIDAGSITVAVLGTGVDVCYPTFHDKLMERICENGMVISEFPPGTQPLKQNFPIRNRIISGLCEATVVCEAPETSGSLITADCALEQGREIYAVPGNITEPTFVGTNNLIKQGAKIITEANDLLKDFGDDYKKISLRNEIKKPDIISNEKKDEENAFVSISSKISTASVDEATDFTKNLTQAEQLIMENLMLKPVHIDILCDKTGLSPNILNSNLTILEMRGLVKSHPGKNFSLNV